jgi:hypothetical protein
MALSSPPYYTRTIRDTNSLPETTRLGPQQHSPGGARSAGRGVRGEKPDCLAGHALTWTRRDGSWRKPESGEAPGAPTSVFFQAPQGRRNVAAGGAPPAARRAGRNPWERGVCDGPAPRGAEESPSPRQGGEKRIGKKKRIGDPLPAHGFRVGPLRGRAAPPVATAPGPVGAEDGPANPRSEIRNALLLHSAVVSAVLRVLCALCGENDSREPRAPSDEPRPGAGRLSSRSPVPPLPSPLGKYG